MPTTWSSPSSVISTSGTLRRSATCSIVGGKPIGVRKLDPYRVAFELEQPYAAAERLFDTLAMLPRHLLEKAQREGRLAAGLGPRHAARGDGRAGPVPAEVVRARRAPGARAEPVLLEGGLARARRCRTWTSWCSSSCPAKTRRSSASRRATPTSSPASAPRTSPSSRRSAAGGYRLQDLGPGLEYTLPVLQPERPRGREAARRRAQAGLVPAARLPPGRLRRPRPARGWSGSSTRDGRPRSATHVTPGNKLWVNARLAPPAPLALPCA